MEIEGYPKEFEFLDKIYKEVHKETKEKTEKDYFTWSECINDWIDRLKPIPREKYNWTLLRFTQFSNIMFWIQTCVFYGQYYSALRELRFMLEFMIKAYYLDIKYADLSMEDKLEKDNKKLNGTTLIKATNLSSEKKGELCNIYTELCGYTHPSKDELARFNVNTAMYFTPSYDEIMFETCVRLTNQVVKNVFYLYDKLFD